jgi:hypothetical protein
MAHVYVHMRTCTMVPYGADYCASSGSMLATRASCSGLTSDAADALKTAAATRRFASSARSMGLMLFCMGIDWGQRRWGGGGVQRDMHRQTHAHAQAHTHKHTRASTHAQAQTHTNTHTHTRLQVFDRASAPARTRALSVRAADELRTKMSHLTSQRDEDGKSTSEKQTTDRPTDRPTDRQTDTQDRHTHTTDRPHTIQGVRHAATHLHNSVQQAEVKHLRGRHHHVQRTVRQSHGTCRRGGGVINKLKWGT